MEESKLLSYSLDTDINDRSVFINELNLRKQKFRLIQERKGFRNRLIDDYIILWLKGIN